MTALITLHPGIEREIRVNPGYISNDSEDAFLISSPGMDTIFATDAGFVIEGIVRFVCKPGDNNMRASVRLVTDGRITCTIGN